MMSAAAYAVYKKLCQQHQVEIRREASSTNRSDGGAALKVWSVASRGSLPALAVNCRRQALNTDEAIAAGVTSGKRTWKLYFYADPKLDKRDRVYFTDGYAVEADVFTPSFQHDSADQAWNAVVIEFGPAKG